MYTDLYALCATTNAGEQTTTREASAEEPTLATIELSPDFKRRIIAGYATDTKGSLIISTLRESSEENRDARMPYYIDNDLLYQRQVTLDSKNKRLYIPRALAGDLFTNIQDKSGQQGFERCLAGLQHFVVHKGAPTQWA